MNLEEDDASSHDESSGDESENDEHKLRRRKERYEEWEHRYQIRLIAYVNTNSGGKAGKGVLAKLRTRIPKNQVHDLLKPLDGVIHTLPGHFKDLEEENTRPGNESHKIIRIVGCGGDGTVGWIASSLENLPQLPYVPDMAVLPLGTGNDLAKVLKWGKYFDKIENFKCKRFLERVFTVCRVVVY